MNELVYPRERILGKITLVLGILVWLGLIAGTFGIALVVLSIGFILYLFAQSALIAHIKGNGVELSESQFPDLYKQFASCCDQLNINIRPQVYILNGDGGLNAFATKFLGTQYVVLMSDVVDAMNEHTDGVQFYIGHELGHLRMKHLNGHLLRWPVLWLPLLGAAYSRARESTCDRHGLACSSSPEGAAKALAALSAGSERWKNLNVSAYLEQVNSSSSFWMSFHELIAGYPWLTKRAARVMNTEKAMPKRNPFAYMLAIFVPYAGRLGAGFAMIITIYIVGVLAAIAIPQYKSYKAKAIISSSIINSQNARDTLANYYETHRKTPESLDAAGVDSAPLSSNTHWLLDPEEMILTISTTEGNIIFTPLVTKSGDIIWSCSNGEGLVEKYLPSTCQNIENNN